MEDAEAPIASHDDRQAKVAHQQCYSGGDQPRGSVSLPAFDGGRLGSKGDMQPEKDAIFICLTGLKSNDVAVIHQMFTLFGNHDAQLLRFVM